LIGEDVFDVYRITAFGNLFLLDRAARVHRLEVSRGTFDLIADSVERFEQKLGDVGNRRLWLLPFLVELLRRDGVVLKPGQCYSFKHPVHLGGGAFAENVEISDLLVHVSFLGQLHRQTTAAPPPPP
jgi:hypothetical protein